MTLTMSPQTRALVESALINKGARYVNRVSDTATRDSLSATLTARAAANARMAGVARTKAELDALMLQYPAGYLHRVDMAFTLSKRAKAASAAWRRHANVVGFTPSDTRLRRLAILHSALVKLAAKYWDTPAALIDLDATNPHNRFMRKVHSNMAGKWRDLHWAAVDAADIWQTATELVIRELRIERKTPENDPAPIPTIGRLYRGLNRAYSLERRIAFGTRAPGSVTVDDVSELAYNSAFFAQVERLETMGRILLTPETLISESFSDLMGTHPELPGERVLLANYATRLDSAKAVRAAQDDEREYGKEVATRNDARRVTLALMAQTEATDASAQYGASIVALLLEGNTLTDIAEFFGLTVDTVSRYALSTRDGSPVREETVTAENETETERPKLAHWDRRRKSLYLLGHPADKFTGVPFRPEPIPEAQPWLVTA